MPRAPFVLLGSEPADPPSQRVMASAGYQFSGLDDPALAEFVRGGVETASGAVVTTHTALRNTSIYRAVTLISQAMGMLPLQLLHEETKEKANDLPLYRLLHREPNKWQTAYEFRALMESRALTKGNAYALVAWSRNMPIALNPLDPDRVTPFQRSDLSVAYKYSHPTGGEVIFEPQEILHIRGSLSVDGISGLSMVHQAREAIGLALQTERASARLFKNGVLAGSALKMPTGSKLSQEAFDRLVASIDAKAGAENAGKNLLLEEGLDFVKMAQTAVEAQLIEMRRFQVEEVSRVSGVPRPLLMMDAASWGTGIDVLGRFFVDYALAPRFTAWEQSCERVLLVGAQKDDLAIKFNPGALLRGSIKDQTAFFQAMLGAGGHQPFGSVNEARALLDWPKIAGGDVLPERSGVASPPPKEQPDDEAIAAAAAERAQARLRANG